VADPHQHLGGIPAVEGIASLLPLILIFVLFYFLVIRRSQRQQQQVRDVQRSLTVGQQVMTTAGLYAAISAVEDDVVVLEIAPGVHVRYARQAVARVVTPDSATTDAPAITDAAPPEPTSDASPDARPDRP
jgi:preprotein translocase subunit YajC